MISIFVLEDDFVQQSRMERTIKEVMKKNSWKYRRIHIYGKPNQLLESITERGSHQLFFLDIQIKNEAKRGFEIAEEIRRKDPNAIVILILYLTSIIQSCQKPRSSFKIQNIILPI